MKAPIWDSAKQKIRCRVFCGFKHNTGILDCYRAKLALKLSKKRFFLTEGPILRYDEGNLKVN
jgi:hypothetical protein